MAGSSVSEVRTPAGGGGWPAIGSFLVLQMYIYAAPMSTDVPRDFDERQARAFAEVHERAEEAFGDPDPLALERALKQLLNLLKLLLRQSRRGGNCRDMDFRRSWEKETRVVPSV